MWDPDAGGLSVEVFFSSAGEVAFMFFCNVILFILFYSNGLP